LSWLPGGEFAAYFLASHAGLFAAEGLDVQLIAGKGATETLTQIATGAADMGTAGLDALLHAKLQNDVPVTAVMAFYSKMPDALVTTAESGIKSLKDVSGKKIATSPFSSSNGPWPFLLRMNGVDPANVQLVKVDPNALSPMLATGQVDAIIQFVTVTPGTDIILKEAKKTLSVIPWADYGLAGYICVVASQKMLSTRREAVIKFTRALKKAEEMMKADPDKAADAVKAMVPEADLTVTQAVARATIPLIFNENTTRDGLGILSPEVVKSAWEWVAKQENLSPTKLNPMASVDSEIAKGM
jgi:NitT/TauT family transport system substrate-binding protein